MDTDIHRTRYGINGFYHLLFEAVVDDDFVVIGAGDNDLRLSEPLGHAARPVTDFNDMGGLACTVYMDNIAGSFVANQSLKTWGAYPREARDYHC